MDLDQQYNDIKETTLKNHTQPTQNYFIEDIIVTCFDNIPFLILFTLILWVALKIYQSAKERFEELNLFNTDCMTEEEKRLFFFTQKLTNINEKSVGKLAQTSANKGNNILIIISI